MKLGFPGSSSSFGVVKAELLFDTVNPATLHAGASCFRSCVLHSKRDEGAPDCGGSDLLGWLRAWRSFRHHTVRLAADPAACAYDRASNQGECVHEQEVAESRRLAMC